MPIERAVRTNAEQTAGSNEAARHARGVSALTIRPMNTALPPDADFVDLEFVPREGTAAGASGARSMRQAWFVRYAPATVGAVEAAAASGPPAVAAPAASPPPSLSFAARSSLDLGRESTARSSELLFTAPPAPASAPPPTAPTQSHTADVLAFAAVLGIDTSVDAVREARQIIFEPRALSALHQANVGDELRGIRGSASPSSVDDESTGTEIPVRVPWNAAFRARKVTIDGEDYGHIHIRTFYVPDADGFVAEFVRLLQQVPDRGLILDVRGNGGGNIWAAERLLQTLTATEIDPERMQFIVSAGTLELCRNNPAGSPISLDQWLRSLEEGVETGAVYSHAFPLTIRESCNALGQQHYGPVVLVVDGNCYSATDIFAAGFQDHGIGKVLGVSHATGAGGANVWEHSLLHQVLPVGWGLKPLPAQAGMRVAIRQCLRVGTQAGSLLEDFGVVPNEVHLPTRTDVLEGDRELFVRAAGLLRDEQTRSIQVTPGALTAVGQRTLTIRTRNLRRLDFYVDDRPQTSIDLEVDPMGAATLDGAAVRTGSMLRLVGFAEMGGRPVATYRTPVT